MYSIQRYLRHDKAKLFRIGLTLGDSGGKSYD